MKSSTTVKFIHLLKSFIDDDDDDDDDDDEMSRNEEIDVRHPSAQMDDTENLAKHWPCAVKMHFPGQHIRPSRIYTYVYIYIYEFRYLQ